MSGFRLSQDATYWSVASEDDNGDPVYNAGINVKSKWKKTDGIFTDEKGNDHKVKYFLYSETLIPKRSLVVLEDKNGVATPDKGARIVLDIFQNPSISTLNKMLL